MTSDAPHLKVGDLVKPTTKWLDIYPNSVGIVAEVYKMTLEQTGHSYWCCKVFMDGFMQVGPIVDFELVEKE